MIEGRLKLDTWETDGQKRSKLKVIGEKMVLCGARSGGGARGGSQQYDEGGEYGEPSGPPLRSSPQCCSCGTPSAHGRRHPV